MGNDLILPDSVAPDPLFWLWDGVPGFWWLDAYTEPLAFEQHFV